MKNFVSELVRNEDGATAIEYGLIAALIAVASITAMTSIGTELSAIFGNAATKLGSANSAA
jgi:pilus assembly protein Flp/PilA